MLYWVRRCLYLNINYMVEAEVAPGFCEWVGLQKNRWANKKKEKQSTAATCNTAAARDCIQHINGIISDLFLLPIVFPPENVQTDKQTHWR